VPAGAVGRSWGFHNKKGRSGMADIQKARSAFVAMVRGLDPDLDCTIPPKSNNGTFLVTLSRQGEEQIVKVAEKELISFETDERLHQKLEERVLSAIEELPAPFGLDSAAIEEPDEEEEIEEDPIDDDDDEEEDEDIEEEFIDDEGEEDDEEEEEKKVDD